MKKITSLKLVAALVPTLLVGATTVYAQDDTTGTDNGLTQNDSTTETDSLGTTGTDDGLAQGGTGTEDSLTQDNSTGTDDSLAQNDSAGTDDSLAQNDSASTDDSLAQNDSAGTSGTTSTDDSLAMGDSTSTDDTTGSSTGSDDELASSDSTSQDDEFAAATSPSDDSSSQSSSSSAQSSSSQSTDHLTSLPEQGFFADQLMGSVVRGGSDDTEVGTVSDVILGEDGEVVAVVVTTGGVMGLGEREVSIAWDEVQREGEGENIELSVDMTNEELQDAPEFARN